jgi:hypothetical protein
MNMRSDRDLGQHLELDHVLNQIVSVFSNDDEQIEELAAMLASDEPLVVIRSYEPVAVRHHQTRIAMTHKSWHTSKILLRKY